MRKFLLCLILFVAGCADVNRVSPIRVPFTDVIPEAKIAQSLNDNPPKTVAVLPFRVTSEDGKKTDPAAKTDPKKVMAESILRRTFFHYFSTLGYADINIDEVESKLADAGITEDEIYSAQPDWKKIGDAVGADAVIVGKVTKISNFVGGIYSETILGAEMRMVRASDGEELWSCKHSESDRSGFILKGGSVVGFVEGEVEKTKENMAFVRVAEELSRLLVRSIPDADLTGEMPEEIPAVAGAGTGPLIAVMPFESSDPDAPEELVKYLRRRFVAVLREFGLRVAEPAAVDRAIQKGWFGSSEAKVKRALDPNVIVKGTLTELHKEYMVIHSQLSLAADILVLDAKEEEVLNRYSRRQTHTAGLLKAPTGIASAVVQPILGVDSYYYFQLANDLARDLAQPIVYWIKPDEK